MVIVNVNYILLALEKHTSFLQYEINYECKKFYDTGPDSRGQSHKTFLVEIYLLFCKLDHFIGMQQILFIFIKWYSLQKSVGKFTLK